MFIKIRNNNRAHFITRRWESEKIPLSWKLWGRRVYDSDNIVLIANRSGVGWGRRREQHCDATSELRTCADWEWRCRSHVRYGSLVRKTAARKPNIYNCIRNTKLCTRKRAILKLAGEVGRVVFRCPRSSWSDRSRAPPRPVYCETTLVCWTLHNCFRADFGNIVVIRLYPAAIFATFV